MDPTRQVHSEADQISLLTTTSQGNQREDHCPPQPTISATLETLQICALLPSIKIAVFDTTPEILDPKGHVLDVLYQKSGAEGEAFRLVPFNPLRPNAQSKVVVCKRRKQKRKQNLLPGPTENEILRYSTVNEILAFSLCQKSPFINNLLGIAFAPGSEQDLERSWDVVLLMDYAPLGNLELFMGQNPDLSGSVRMSFARDIFSGIQALHEANLVWGDGKPANILVFANPDDLFGYTLKLTDFGSTTSPKVYWETASFPCGSVMWKSAYSIFRTTKTLIIGEDLEQHSRHCFHFDTFVAGLLLLFLLIGLDKYKTLEIVRLLEAGTGATSSKESFDELNFAIKAKAALDSHLAELSQRKTNSGISQQSLKAVETIFKTALSWDPPAGSPSLMSWIDECLPRKSASSIADNCDRHKTGLLIEIKKSDLPSTRLGGQDNLQREGTPIQGHSYNEIRGYLRKHVSSRKLEREILKCCETYRTRFGWDMKSMHLPRGLELVVRSTKARDGSDTGSDQEKTAQREPEESIAVLCLNLEIDKLATLAKSRDPSEYSRFSEEGLASLAYAVQDDDSILTTRPKPSTEGGYLDLQMQVVKWLVRNSSDMMNCTVESDTILTWAARHGSFDLFKELYTWLKDKHVTQLKQMLCFENIATDGTKWTLLRAAMLRHETDIFEFVLEKINFEEECKRRFEKDFTYLHLCALLEPELGIRFADLFLKKGKNMYLDELLATDGVTGLQLSPFALAALKGNMEFAHYLSKSNPLYALFSSVIPPSIVPPTDLEQWAECRILPSEKALKLPCWVSYIPYIRRLWERISSLTDTTLGAYSESQLSRELSRPYTGGRMWTTMTLKRGWVPWIERKMVRLNHRFLIHYGLNVGFRGPFMHSWLIYRTVLDQLVLEGKQTNAQALTEHLLADGHSDVVQRAVGEGIRRLYQLQTSILLDNAPNNPEREYQDLLFQATDKIVILMMIELHRKDKKGTVEFFTKAIRLDNFTQPDSFFRDGRFIFGLTPESVTSLCHLAVFGGLSELVRMFSFEGQTLIQDGAGRSPLDRARDELDAERAKGKSCASRYSAEREAKLQAIVKHLEESTGTVTQRRRVITGTRMLANTFAWSIILCLVELVAIMWLWRFDSKMCKIYREGIFYLGFWIALLSFFIVKIIKIGLGGALVRMNVWDILQYGWLVLLIGTEVTAVLLTGWIQRAACKYFSWPLDAVSFVLVFALLTWFTVRWVMRLPLLCHSIALGFRRAKLLQYLECPDHDNNSENEGQPIYRDSSPV